MEDTGGKHPEVINGWDNLLVEFGIKNGNEIEYFEGVVKLKNTAQGRVFYDITQIKRTRGLQGSMSSHSDSISIISNSEDNASKNSNSNKSLGLKLNDTPLSVYQLNPYVYHTFHILLKNNTASC